MGQTLCSSETKYFDIAFGFSNAEDEAQAKRILRRNNRDAYSANLNFAADM